MGERKEGKGRAVGVVALQFITGVAPMLLSDGEGK